MRPQGDLAPVVGANLKRLRAARALSLEKLATASGVSRAMLGQIEHGQSAPTINVLWKIATALGVPFSALLATESEPGPVVLRAAKTRRVSSHDGAFVTRALFPTGEAQRVELYELRLAAKKREDADPHPPGTTENLVVSAGKLELDIGGETHELDTGDAIFFVADVPHTYRNPGTRAAVMYLVMTYAQRRG